MSSFVCFYGVLGIKPKVLYTLGSTLLTELSVQHQTGFKTLFYNFPQYLGFLDLHGFLS